MLLGLLIAAIVISPIATLSYKMMPVNAETISTTSGINYMSNGNAWAEPTATLDSDFSRFRSDGVTHLSIRIMWSVTEPTHYDATPILARQR